MQLPQLRLFVVDAKFVNRKASEDEMRRRSIYRSLCKPPSLASVIAQVEMALAWIECVEDEKVILSLEIRAQIERVQNEVDGLKEMLDGHLWGEDHSIEGRTWGPIPRNWMSG